MSLSNTELERYTRHLSLPNFSAKTQEKIKNARVFVVGGGGLGCPVIQYLSGAGVGNIGIIDNDVVALSNLQRQVLYKENQIGLSKSKTASKFVQTLNSNIEVKYYDEQLTPKNIERVFKTYDIIVDGSDNFPTRYLVNDACVVLKKPLVYGAVYRFEGQVSVFNLPSEGGAFSANYRDLFPELPAPDSIPSCVEGGVLGTLTGIIGCMQANEAVKLITGLGALLTNKLLVFDGLSSTQHIFKIGKKVDNSTIKIEENYSLVCDTDNVCINVQKLKELKNRGEIEIIDVREEWEYALQNKGGLSIPLGKLKECQDKIPKDKTIVCVCQSGIRSMEGVQILNGLGIEAKSLEGGINAWQEYRN